MDQEDRIIPIHFRTSGRGHEASGTVGRLPVAGWLIVSVRDTLLIHLPTEVRRPLQGRESQARAWGTSRTVQIPSIGTPDHRDIGAAATSAEALSTPPETHRPPRYTTLLDSPRLLDRWMNSRFGQFEFRYSPSPQARSRR